MENSRLQTYDEILLQGVAPAARGQGDYRPPLLQCPLDPYTPFKRPRIPRTPLHRYGHFHLFLDDRVHIGHTIWFGLGPATNRVPGRTRTLHGPDAGARTCGKVALPWRYL